VPNASRKASRALASCSSVRHPRFRSCSTTHAAASAGFEGHDAPGSPGASALLEARRNTETTSSTSRGSRVAHASTSHDGGGGRLSAAPIALVGRNTPTTTKSARLHSFLEEKDFLEEKENDGTLRIYSASRAVASHSGARDRAHTFFGWHSRAARADGGRTWRRRCPTPISAC
jgi:hypothetical protein